MSTGQQPTAAARLRELLSDSSHTVVAPGVYDGISARLALAQGFECLYMVSEDLHPCGEPPQCQIICRANGSSQYSVSDITWARNLASKSVLLILPLRAKYGV